MLETLTYVLHGFSIVTSECWRVLAAVLACRGWDRGDWGWGCGDMLATPLIPPTTAGVSLRTPGMLSSENDSITFISDMTEHLKKAIANCHAWQISSLQEIY